MQRLKMETIWTNCPIAEIKIMNLAERVLLDQNIDFKNLQQEIIWIRETESRISFWHGGIELKEGSTYSDYYGFFTSYDGAIEDVEKICLAYKITPESSLELKITMTIEQYPVIFNPEIKQNLNSKMCYESISDKHWYINDQDVLKEYKTILNDDKSDFSKKSDAFELIDPLKIKRIKLIENFTVWSSKEDMSLQYEDIKSKYWLNKKMSLKRKI